MIGVKRGLYSLGIAFLVSAPISRFAMQSWDNSPQVIIEEPQRDLSGLQDSLENMQKIAEEEATRAELIAAEEARQAELDMQQQEIISEAYKTLELYQVTVPADIKEYCEEAQEESNVCAELLEAVCWRESTFTPSAENAGCSGIMQISTKWHRDRMKRLGVSDIYDAKGNIRVGADYLAELFKDYDGDTYKVLMEYNGDSSMGISNYAIEICEVSAALERIHGK